MFISQHHGRHVCTVGDDHNSQVVYKTCYSSPLSFLRLDITSDRQLFLCDSARSCDPLSSSDFSLLYSTLCSIHLFFVNKSSISHRLCSICVILEDRPEGLPSASLPHHVIALDPDIPTNCRECTPLWIGGTRPFVACMGCRHSAGASCLWIAVTNVVILTDLILELGAS